MRKIVVLIFLVTFIQILSIPLNKPLRSEISYPPKINLSKDSLNFHRLNKNSNSSMVFFLSNLFDGTLKGELITFSNWIELSSSTFEGNLIKIDVKLNVRNLLNGLYMEKIEIKSNGGNITLPIRFELIDKETIIQLQFDNPDVFINSNPTRLKYPPFVYKALSYVPLRLICESFGATVTFQQNGKNEYKTINVKYQDINVQIPIGGDFITLNGNKQMINGTVEIRNYLAFVPISVIETIFYVERHFNPSLRLTTLIY
jgi:hypothetical protein